MTYRRPFLFAISTRHDRKQKLDETLSHSTQKRIEKKSPNSACERKIERIEHQKPIWNVTSMKKKNRRTNEDGKKTGGKLIKRSSEKLKSCKERTH